MKASLRAAAIVGIAIVAAGAAHAGGDVRWNVSIGLPFPVVPVVYQQPQVVVQPQVVYQQPQVVYQQPQVVYQQPRVVYQQPRVVVQPQQVIYAPAQYDRCDQRGRGHGQGHGRGHGRAAYYY